MKSYDYKTSPKLLRNEFPVSETYGMPLLTRSIIPNVSDMISYHDTRKNDSRAGDISFLVHFFKDDYIFESLYNDGRSDRNNKIILRLAQYQATCTPDFSLYPEMPLPVQMYQVFKSRWCGAYWENCGLNVVPTVTWGDKTSFAFCFDGIPHGSPVAVGMLGSAKNKPAFLLGYDCMLETIEPEAVFCYGKAFKEMHGNIKEFPYRAFRNKEIV